MRPRPIWFATVLIGTALSGLMAQAQDPSGQKNDEQTPSVPDSGLVTSPSGTSTVIFDAHAAPPAQVPVTPAQGGPPLGGPGLGGMGGGMPGLNPVVGRVPRSVGYQGTEFFNEPVRGQNTHLGYFRQDLNLLGPLWQDDTDEVSATARVGVESFDTRAILPTSGDRFPADLWNIQLGSGYRHLFDNGWIGGGTVSVGSASDRPFNGLDEMSISAGCSLRVPSGERNAWLFSVMVSSNSQVLPFLPIPGVAYFYNPNDHFQALIGFPFASVIYRPIDDLTLSLTYALLTNVHARANYRIAGPLCVFAGLDFNSENYYRAGREDNQARLFEYDDRLSAGVQTVLGHGALLECAGGYVFNRYYFEGRNATSSTGNRIDVNDGPFLGARLQIRY